MNILGLHFGHDAAVCILRDGEAVAYVMRERQARIKHAISLEVKTIQAALDAAALRWDQLDFCAITSTQNIELIIDAPSVFSVSFNSHQRHRAPSTLARLVQAQQLDPETLVSRSLLKILYDPSHAQTSLRTRYASAFPEHRTRQPRDFSSFGTMDGCLHHSLWTDSTLAQIALSDFSPLLWDDAVRHGFHYPITVRLGACALPGYFIAHHAAHAASCFYQARFEEAAILTHDGFGNGYGHLSGMYFRGAGHRIFPVAPHHLAIGGLYDFVGEQLGLGAVGASGKLMGLAAYGQPRFYDARFRGNQYDWVRAGVGLDAWWQHCLQQAQKQGYDMAPLGDPAQARAPVNVDLAASTQKLFEETYLVAAETLHQVLSRMGRRTEHLCLSGGCALNCPSNSRLFRESRFSRVFVEPGCDDSGLAIGAASWLQHNILDHPLPTRAAASASPYLGLEVSADAIRAALEAAGDAIEFTVCPDPAAAAAEDLAQDRVVGWFEGRSEIGPRALGHRSILADPRPAENWNRVNRLKGREAWRPFAPAILAAEAGKWFGGLPSSSPFMLFTGAVLSDQLPAITHADGSARVQTVDASCGEFFRLLTHFFACTGMPVLLNTSFNGPGEPIVETPQDALRFFTHSALDALYFPGLRVTRRNRV